MGLALLAAASPAAAQDLVARCERGCIESATNRSLNLLLHQDASAPITIAWESGRDPAAGGRQVVLYAGNPEWQDNLPARGRLEFVEQQGVWRATHDFQGSELGRGTFLAVVTARPQGSGEDSDKERILDWRAFRLLTVAEDRARVEGPAPPSGFFVTVTPALLQAHTGHGNLPRSQNGDDAVWWSLMGRDGNTTDLDLDGENNGIPGLSVQASTPWETRSPPKSEADILGHFKGAEGHTVRFDGFEWQEVPDRTVSLGNLGRIDLRNYYTAITLHTTASIKTFTRNEVGGGLLRSNSFSHETSARLKDPGDPRLWASYSRREYGADPRLLEILRRQVAEQGTVPGLVGIQVAGGDGGTPIYTVGFYVAVRPWEERDVHGGGAFRAGIVSVDVVAARTGVGGLTTRGSGGAGTIGNAWCKVVGCGDQAKPLDLDRPPEGYRGASAAAILHTVSGNLPLIDGTPQFAEKASPILAARGHAAIPNLPARARFGVEAQLRAGALMQQGKFGPVKDIIPIDTYAQFVVRITVAMFPDVTLVSNVDATIPARFEFGKEITVPRPPPSIWRRYRIALILLGLVGIVLLVPGGLGLVRATLGAIVKALRFVVDAISSWLDRLRERKPRGTA